MALLPGAAGDVDVAQGKFLNSANGSGNQSLSKLPDLDQGTVNKVYQADLGNGLSVFSNPLGPLGQIFGDIAGLPDAFGRLISALFGTNGPWGTISGAINSIEHNIIGGIQTTVSLIQAAINVVSDFVNSIVQALIRAYNSIPFLGDIHTAGIPALTTAIQDQQGNQQAAVVTVASSTIGANQSWMAPYAVADVSYPKIFHSALQIEGFTGPATTGTAHTHDTFGTNGITSGNFAAVPLTSTTPGTMRGSFVVTRVATVYDTVAMYLGSNAAGINNVFVEVWRKDSSGTITQISSQEISASIQFAGSNVASYHEFPLPAPIIANIGESYAVTARNSTTNTALMETRAMWSEDRGGLVFLSVNTSKKSYTASDIALAQTAAAQSVVDLGTVYPLPWAMLATAADAPTEKTYADNFDNRSAFGPLWVMTSNVSGGFTPTLVGNRFNFGGGSLQSGDELGLYTLPVGGDQMLVEANIYSRDPASKSGLMLCCNRELTQTVYVSLNQALMQLSSGPWNGLTTRASWPIPVGTGDAKWSVWIDPTTGIFTILKDGNAFETWTSAGLVQFGEMFRYGGLRTSKSSVAGAGPGGPMDNFVFRDFTP